MPNEFVIPEFTYFQCISSEFKRNLIENSSSTTLPIINKSRFSNLTFYLAPLPEQTRIVAKLDKLFGHLEKLKARLGAIPVLLKQFRQSVLTRAVTGKLTKSEAKYDTLENYLLNVKYGTAKKSRYNIEGVPVLRIPNIVRGEIDSEDLKYSELNDKEFEKTKLGIGDVLIIRSNGSVRLVGQSAIVRKEHENYSYAGYLIRLRTNDELNSEYLNYCLKSNYVRAQIVKTAKSTSGVNNINSQEIRRLLIPIFPKREQEEIVERIGSLFEKSNKLESRYNSLNKQIENLPQAILAKAFRGELIPQLDTDGSAEDLLKEIKRMHKSMNMKTRKINRK